MNGANVENNLTLCKAPTPKFFLIGEFLRLWHLARQRWSSGARPWDKLLTHEISLEGLPALFADPPEGYLKAIVRP